MLSFLKDRLGLRTVAFASVVLLLDPELTFRSMLRTKEALLSLLPPSSLDEEPEEMLCWDLCLFQPTFFMILSTRAEEALETVERALLLSLLLLLPRDMDL